MPQHSFLNREGELKFDEQERRKHIDIQWQTGHIQEAGINGCFPGDVIEMVIEKLDALEDERPELSCRENSLAKTHLELAWMYMDQRRANRARAGVLSTYLPIPKPEALPEPYTRNPNGDGDGDGDGD